LAIAALIVAGVWYWHKDRQIREVQFVESEAGESATDRFRNMEALVELGIEGVPELTRLATDSDPRRRRLAIQGLGRIGPDAAGALEAVRQAVNDDDPQTRRQAVRTFWLISKDPESAAPLVAPRLADSNSEVREMAAESLGQMGLPAVEPVIQMLHSDSPATRSRALQLLGDLRRFARAEAINAAVRSTLDDPNPEIRVAALCQLALTDQSTLGELRTLLNCPDDGSPASLTTAWGRRSPLETALEAITRRGPEAAELLPDIARLFESWIDLEIRKQFTFAILHGTRRRLPAILHAIASMKAAGQPAIPALLRRFDELNEDQRSQVATTLVDIGAPPEQVTPVLVTLLNETVGWATSHRAGAALVRVDPAEARRQVSLFIPHLSTREDRPHTVALHAIKGMAPVAEEAVPALMKLVSDAPWRVSNDAMLTLGDIGAPASPAVPYIVLQLRNVEVANHQIINALGRIGPAAQPALPVLIEMIADPRAFLPASSHDDLIQTFRLAAIESVGRIGIATPEVLSVLDPYLRDESPRTRLAVLTSLALIDPDSSLVVEGYLDLLADANHLARLQAALDIGRLKLSHPRIVSTLEQRLRDESPHVRTATVVALGRIGPAAGDALPALRDMLDRPGNSLPLAAFGPDPWVPGPLPLGANISVHSGTTLETALKVAIREIESAETDSRTELGEPSSP
jgi:HEAT repeat protein